MGRLIGRRLLLMVPTLILVSILVFALAEVLPGNVGRFILGPYATQSAVDQLNRNLGMYKPIYTRYVEWAGHFVTGHWGTSLQYSTPVSSIVWHALGNSLLLAGFALVIIIPTSILVGVYAGGVVLAVEGGVAVAVHGVEDEVGLRVTYGGDDGGEVDRKILHHVGGVRLNGHGQLPGDGARRVFFAAHGWRIAPRLAL